MAYSEEEKIKILYEDSLQEIRKVVNQIESVAAIIVAAADTVAGGKQILHSRNEKFLMDQVKHITDATRELRDYEGVMQKSVQLHTTALLSPLVEVMASHIKKLHDKDSLTMRLVQQAAGTNKKIADNMFMGALLGLVLFCAGCAIGRLWG